MDKTIREATESDHDKILQVYLSAFGKEERALVANLAIELLNTDSNSKTVNLIAEDDDEVVGHVAFSPVQAQNSYAFIGYILAPLAVSPHHQNQGVGSVLVRKGLERLPFTVSAVVLVYGDPAYYGRFGFSSELAEKYIPPFSLSLPLGWQALALSGRLPPKNPKKITCVEPLNKPELW